MFFDSFFCFSLRCGVRHPQLLSGPVRRMAVLPSPRRSTSANGGVIRPHCGQLVLARLNAYGGLRRKTWADETAARTKTKKRNSVVTRCKIATVLSFVRWMRREDVGGRDKLGHDG
jgi:hypothetical protein